MKMIVRNIGRIMPDKRPGYTSYKYEFVGCTRGSRGQNTGLFLCFERIRTSTTSHFKPAVIRLSIDEAVKRFGPTAKDLMPKFKKITAENPGPDALENISQRLEKVERFLVL